jgi:hypothetical protein
VWKGKQRATGHWQVKMTLTDPASPGFNTHTFTMLPLRLAAYGLRFRDWTKPDEVHRTVHAHR